MLIMVAGGRDYGETRSEERLIRRKLEAYAQVGNILLSGGARGADSLAEEIWTLDFQLPAMVAPAPWDRVGKAAGPVRTYAILTGTAWSPYMTQTPDVVLAFPGGKGTEYTVKSARKLGVEVVFA
jgi:hypothetical protein